MAETIKSLKTEEKAFGILLMIMAVYYGWRMFSLTPWYDELYTYYCFISKGPVYAAIHWPLPNNHVGYSVLSGFLDYLGNPYIGLRGVSYICALVNLFLIYKIAERYFKGWQPLGIVLLYLSMGMVNQMAVQGRGYTLGVTCYLTAFWCMAEICEKDQVPGKLYFLYIVSLTLGLYTVSSDVYWVIPLCLAGGMFLLCRSMITARSEKLPVCKTMEWKRLIHLILASLGAAVLTIFLYATIWLAIGSNLLVKDETSSYYGMGHVDMILKAPFDAILRGAGYMLDTPYIQSEARDGFFSRLLEWFVNLSGGIYGGLSIFTRLLWGFGCIWLLWQVIRKICLKEKKGLLLDLFLVTGFCFIPAVLLIQCKRPYYRVFTYVGVLTAFLLGRLLFQLSEFIKTKYLMEKSVYADGIVAVLILVLVVKYMGFTGYNEQYSLRESQVQDVLEHVDTAQYDRYCVTDCYQEYLLHFLYDIRCENTRIEDSEVVVLDKRMTDPEFDEMVWEFYHYYDSIPWDYIEEKMQISYENEGYILYTAD